MYKQENIQKLARRLRFPERDLMALARDRLPLELPPQLQAPPEDLPPEYWGDDDAIFPAGSERFAGGSAASRLGRGGGGRRAIEPHCMSLLLRNPNLLSLVNRKLARTGGRR